jgi:hypothetical protein
MALSFEMMRARRVPRYGRRHWCEVQPHDGCPDGCKARATWELTFLGATSWLCDPHFEKVKAELDAGSACQLLPDRGPGRN